MATERVDTHSGRVLVAASRIRTGAAERQRVERGACCRCRTLEACPALAGI